MRKAARAQTGDNGAPAHLAVEGEGDKQVRLSQCLPNPPKQKGSPEKSPPNPLKLEAGACMWLLHHAWSINPSRTHGPRDALDQTGTLDAEPRLVSPPDLLHLHGSPLSL